MIAAGTLLSLSHLFEPFKKEQKRKKKSFCKDTDLKLNQLPAGAIMAQIIIYTLFVSVHMLVLCQVKYCSPPS